MDTWEYKTVSFKATGWLVGGKLNAPEIEYKLSKLGKEGWELVNIFNSAMFLGASRDVVATLKRKL